jgi:PilZ domain
MDDRRSRPRLSVNLDVLWDSNEGRQTARITNLSEEGCYLDSVGETLVGEIVCFRVLMPDEDWLYLEGEVRHSRPDSGFGVRFVDLNEEQREKIELILGEIKASGGRGAPISADLIPE